MKALVYKGDGQVAIEEKAIPEIQDAGDAIVKVVYSTICGFEPQERHATKA
jgi:alcohol dehydrogenase